MEAMASHIYVPTGGADPLVCLLFREARLQQEGRPGGPPHIQAQKEEAAMSQDKFPAGWDDGKIQRVLAHYGERAEDEALAEDEAGVASSETDAV
jgi:hypothetical protein